MRATQIEDCKKDYNTAAEQKNVAEAFIEDKLQTLPDLKKEVSVWEKKYQFHQSLENKKESIQKLKTELAWSMSKKTEAEHAKTSREVFQARTKNTKS